jgi:hypothetical protein
MIGGLWQVAVLKLLTPRSPGGTTSWSSRGLSRWIARSMMFVFALSTLPGILLGFPRMVSSPSGMRMSLVVFSIILRVLPTRALWNMHPASCNILRVVRDISCCIPCDWHAFFRDRRQTAYSSYRAARNIATATSLHLLLHDCVTAL